MIKFSGQSQSHKAQVSTRCCLSIISSTDLCVLANHLLWVWNIPLLHLVSNSQTQMPPPCTESKHLSSGLEYLYKIMKKSQGNIRATAGRAQHTAIHYHLSTEQEYRWQLLSCCSLCKNMQRPRDSPIQTSRNAHHRKQHLISQIAQPITSSSSCSEDQAAGGFKNTDFIPHFAARGGIFPPCKLGGLKIVQAGSTASKLLESQDMSNIGVDTGFEAQGSPAEFNKSSSRLALLLSAGLAVSKLPLLQVSQNLLCVWADWCPQPWEWVYSSGQTIWHFKRTEHPKLACLYLNSIAYSHVSIFTWSCNYGIDKIVLFLIKSIPRCYGIMKKSSVTA